MMKTISTKSIILVVIQFSCFFILLFGGDILTKGYFLIIQVISLLFTLWATLTLGLGNFNIEPEVKESAKFVTTGPYKLSRNPIYSGLIAFFSITVFYNIKYYNLITLIILLIVLIMKIDLEEKFLEEKFGKKYITYKKSSYRLIPFIY